MGRPSRLAGHGVDPRHVGSQFSQYGLCLHPGQWGSQAHVCAVPELDVHAGVAVRAVLVGSSKTSGSRLAAPKDSRTRDPLGMVTSPHGDDRRIVRMQERLAEVAQIADE